jgi:hypothetical protein
MPNLKVCQRQLKSAVDQLRLWFDPVPPLRGRETGAAVMLRRRALHLPNRPSAYDQFWPK